jgi:hypothetical protein
MYWVLAVEALVGVALLGIAIQRHWDLVPAIVNQVAKQTDPRFGEAAEREARERTKKIQDEIATTAEPIAWAGSYYEGDGLGENVIVSLAPKSGFVFEWSGCMGLYDRNFGSVEAHPEMIEFRFTFENVREGFRGLSQQLVPIRWDERHYLVPVDRMERFCIDVNSGAEPRNGGHGRYLLRRGDESRRAGGLPIVPALYAKRLLTEPLVATVIEVLDFRTDEKGVVRCGLTLDVGSEQGVVLDMPMIAIEPKNPVMLHVKDVQAKTSRAALVLHGADSMTPKVGWKFTSRVWEK